MMDLLSGADIFKDENDVFIHNGKMNDHFTAPIIQLNSESIGTNSRLNKRLSYFTIECFQNVVRHGEPLFHDENKVTTGMFVYANKKNSIRVCTSNDLKLDVALSFEDRLAKLKSLTQEELSLLYTETLKTSEISSKGGAGLGLIDILLKTKSNVNFKFVPKVNGNSSFMFETVLDNGDTNGSSGAEDFQNFMELNHLILFRKGCIKKTGLLPIYQLVALELKLNEAKNENDYLFAILELVQNVCDHSEKDLSINESLFLKKTLDGSFSFYTGSSVLNSTVATLSESLDKINSYSEEELQQEYERQMSLNLMQSSEKSALGWLKIRKKIKSKLNYQFEKHTEELTYFYIGVTLQ